MKDLHTVEGQREAAPWVPIGNDRLVNPQGHRIRRTTLFCELGGSRHPYEPAGRDFANHGEAGIVEVDVRVCPACGKDKR